MLAAALSLCAAASLTPPQSGQATYRAADFFPLDPTRKLVYEQVANGKTTLVNDLVGPAATVNGESLTPIISKQGFVEISKIYYKVSDDRVEIGSYDGKYPLKPAVPVFYYYGPKSSWTFEEMVQTGPESKDGINAKGTATLSGTRKFEGKDIEILEVIQNAEIGVPPLQETVFQRSVYGKGIGLLEMVSRNTIAGKTQTTNLKLLRVEKR